jgi:hypothetical protein
MLVFITENNNFYWENLKGRNQLGDLSADGGVILI